MRILTPFQSLSAAFAFALLAGCNGGSTTIAPAPFTPQSGGTLRIHRAPLIVGTTRQQIVSHYACPASGPIKYVADGNNAVINVYVGKFASQPPCGQITSGLFGPSGLYVKSDTHDLYVANDLDHNILVFHRGQTSPYNAYTDPTNQYPVDVTVARDGTVIASNSFSVDGKENGSLSTWIGGPNGGTFVGNFPMTNDNGGVDVTIRKNGTVYYDDFDKSGLGAVWTLSCPSGACGAQTQLGIVLFEPDGLGLDNSEDLLAIDGAAQTADTFELPNPSPSTFPVTSHAGSLAISSHDNHIFVVDPFDNNAAEYLYPSGKLVGKVAGNGNGVFTGVAVDPGHAR